MSDTKSDTKKPEPVLFWAAAYSAHGRYKGPKQIMLIEREHTYVVVEKAWDKTDVVNYHRTVSKKDHSIVVSTDKSVVLAVMLEWLDEARGEARNELAEIEKRRDEVLAMRQELRQLAASEALP